MKKKYERKKASTFQAHKKCIYRKQNNNFSKPYLKRKNLTGAISELKANGRGSQCAASQKLTGTQIHHTSTSVILHRFTLADSRHHIQFTHWMLAEVHQGHVTQSNKSLLILKADSCQQSPKVLHHNTLLTQWSVPS